MAHTYTKNHLHVVFSTKERQKLISEQLERRVWKYLTGICQNIGVVAVAVGGMPDHVHMLFHLPPSRALADALRTIKTNSSKLDEGSFRAIRMAGRLRRFLSKCFQSNKGCEVH